MSHQNRIDGSVNATALLVDAVAQIGRFLQTGEVQEDAAVGRESHLARVAFTLAEYAWNGVTFTGTGIHMVDELAEFAVVVELLGANFMLPDGSVCLAGTEKDAITRLANAAEARWQLDQGDAVRFEGLAALAGVAEKTVRAATNPKSAHPIPVSKEGHWAYIEAKDALTWLSRRNDFKTTYRAADGLKQPLVTDAMNLADACRAWRIHNSLSEAELGTALGWTDEQVGAYRAIEAKSPGDVIAQLPPQALLRFAEHLQLPEPVTFARQAYTVLAVAHAHALSDKQVSVDD